MAHAGPNSRRGAVDGRLSRELPRPDAQGHRGAGCATCPSGSGGRRAAPGGHA